MTVHAQLPDEDSEEWLEAHGANVPRVDLVKTAANGSRNFLLMKSAEDDTGAGLLDADTVRSLIKKAAPVLPITATFTGSPADVMHAIHAASQRQKDETMPELLKAETAVEVAAPDEPLPTADEVTVDAVSGDPDDPASPAWEAVDAARARQALQLTIALQRLVQQAVERESQEVAVGSGGIDDMGSVWSLEDVLCCIDDIIGSLAPFAITEQAEADQLTAIVKSGRVLSTTNEAKIRGAVEALTQVLSTLPAPADEATLVAKNEKESSMAKTPTIEGPVIVNLQKAKGDPMTPVYDEGGKLVGMIDAADLVPIASAAEAAEPAAEEVAETPVVEAAEPAPAAENAAVIPGTATVQSPVPVTTEKVPVVKSIQESFTAALAEVLTPITKQLGENAELSGLVKSLQESVDQLSKMPDDRKSPHLNGSVGVAGVADRDGQNLDQFADLKKAVQDAPDDVARVQAQTVLAHAAIKARFAQ